MDSIEIFLFQNIIKNISIIIIDKKNLIEELFTINFNFISCFDNYIEKNFLKKIETTFKSILFDINCKFNVHNINKINNLLII